MLGLSRSVSPPSVVGACLAFLLVQPLFSEAPAYDDEFSGPFSSWANVKTSFGARGDGVTDDTGAFQAALNTIGHPGQPEVLYIPAGTYIISQTLHFQHRQFTGIIGEDPNTTIIRWNGAPGGWLFWADGVTQARYARITWDGNHTAAIDFAFKWNHAAGGYATTDQEHRDEFFINARRCFVGGDMKYGTNDAEVLFIRNHFSDCSEAGISVESWNAVDYWVWDSVFSGNGRGITNEYGAGTFNVYRSVFRNSRVADITRGHTGAFSIRGNTSFGSNQFFHSRNPGQNSAPMTFEDNRILDTADPVAIEDDSVGLLTLIDNQIRSRAQASGPAVRMQTWARGADLASIGNRYTVADPISISCGGEPRWWAQDDQIVPYSSIDGTIPSIPDVAKRLTRPVFEAGGFTDIDIQRAIDRAALFNGQRPIVHLRQGDYSIGRTISAPAADIQIIGDGGLTRLTWTGSGNGTILRLQGPSKVVLNDLMFTGANAPEAIAIENADQPGARIYADMLCVEPALQYAVMADGLSNTKVELHAPNLSVDQEGPATLLVKGAARGGSSAVALFGGFVSRRDSSASGVAMELQQHGSLLVEDCWNEGQAPRIARLTGPGTFTFWSGRVAPYLTTPIAPTFDIHDFTGNATLAAFVFDISPNRGILLRSENSGTKVLVFGLDSYNSVESYFRRAGSGGAVTFINNKYLLRGTGSLPIRNSGDPRTADFMRSTLNQMRTIKPAYTTDLPAGVTDVRIHRVYMVNVGLGLHVKPGVPPRFDSPGQASLK